MLPVRSSGCLPNAIFSLTCCGALRSHITATHVFLRYADIEATTSAKDAAIGFPAPRFESHRADQTTHLLSLRFMLNIFDGIARRTISSDYRPHINHRALKQCPRWQPSSTYIFFPPAPPSDIVHLDTVNLAGQHRPITARTPPRALKQFTLCLSQTSRQRGRRQSPQSRQNYNTSRRRAFANVSKSGDRRSARDYYPVTTVRRLRHRGTYASLLHLSPT